LKQARTEAAAGEEQVKAALVSCDDQASALSKVSTSLGELRASLWAGAPAAAPPPVAPTAESPAPA